VEEVAGHEILIQDNGLGAALCGPVFINIWYGPPTVARLDELATVQRRVMTRERHLVISFIDPRVGREMSDEARRRARDMTDEMAPHTIAHCLIVLESGFFALMARTVITGIYVLSRQRRPWKVFDDVDDGLAWSLERLTDAGKQVDVDELRRCTDALGARHKQISRTG
jgi:hypothetical protein